MAKQKRIGVVLSGCGVMDGAEIHESVIVLLALDRAGAAAVCMAPDMPQASVVDHLTGKAAPGETRNVLVESARIARGEIQNLKAVREADLDGLIFPGGFGAAKNLCDFAQQGTDCRLQPDVERLAREVHAAGKPIGAICIAPALIARLLSGGKQVSLTIGADPETTGALERMGARHEKHAVDEICVDRTAKVVSTPAYMLARSIKEAAAGIEKLVAAVLEMA